MLATHLCLVLRLGICKILSPLPHAPLLAFVTEQIEYYTLFMCEIKL